MHKSLIRYRIILTLMIVCLDSCVTPPRSLLPFNKAGEVNTSAFDILTQHNDSQRTGASLHETILTPTALRSGRFGRLFDWEVDGQIYTQPLYVSQIAYNGRLINMVVVATMNNSVYAFEAPSAGTDVQPSSTFLWRVQKDILGEPLRYDYFSMEWGILGHNIEPLIGITATPVIDRERGMIYVTVKSRSDGIFGLFAEASYELFAIDLLSGKIKASTKITKMTVSYRSPDGFVWTFDPKFHLQRASLLEANDRIYIAFGSHQDTPPYHGWVLAYDANDLKQLAVYCTTCGRPSNIDCRSSSCMGGIWQAGGGLASDSDGKIYAITGNGTYDSDASDRGTSFVKLDKDLNLIGSWTPVTYECLNRTDSDLGSAGPTFLTGTSTLVGGGKEGVLYALKPEALQGAHIQAAESLAGNKAPCEAFDPLPKASGLEYSSIQASPVWQGNAIMDVIRIFEPAVGSQGFHHIHGSPVQWFVHTQTGDRMLLYLSAERDVLRAYEIGNAFISASEPGHDPIDTFQSRCPNSEMGMPGGFLTVSADGAKPESGIVWAAMPRSDEDALHHIVDGVLRAYTAYPGNGNELLEIWNSDVGTDIGSTCQNIVPVGPDQVGHFAKFVPPTLAEGKVYLSTFSHRLVVYGLKEERSPSLNAALEEHYDAALQIRERPKNVQAGSTVAVSITAMNTGLSTWHTADNIRLSSQVIPEATYAPVEGMGSLSVERDVPPGQSYTFSFHFVAPTEEASHHFAWRLVRRGGVTKQAGGDWFGKATNEWIFGSLKLDCAEVRERAKAIVMRIRQNAGKSELTMGEIEATRRDAEAQHCSLNAEVE